MVAWLAVGDVGGVGLASGRSVADGETKGGQRREAACLTGRNGQEEEDREESQHGRRDASQTRTDQRLHRRGLLRP